MTRSGAVMMSPDFSPPVDCRLPANFYAERERLSHIRDAAHNRGRSPDSVLMATVCRFVTIVDYRWVLPPIVGGVGSLNCVAGLIGSSGMGKSSAAHIAEELVPFDDPSWVKPLGSGEGIAAAFLSSRSETDPPRAAMFYVDEGAVVHDLGTRKGATLLPTIRTAAHGGQLGQQNGNRETTRIVPAHSYRLALLAGFQPVNAGPFIRDDSTGTPQRFVWAAVTDPEIPEPGHRPDWPGPLAGWHLEEPDAPRTPLTVSEAIRNEIEWNDHQRATGKVSSTPLDSHRDLERLRLAGVLALFDSRTHVTDDDWRLALAWSAVSANLRDYTAQWWESTRIAEGNNKATREGELRAMTDEAKHAAKIVRLAKRMRDYAANPPNERPFLPNQAWAGRDSDALEAAKSMAVENGWVVFEGNRCLPGPNAEAVNN